MLEHPQQIEDYLSDGSGAITRSKRGIRYRQTMIERFERAKDLAVAKLK